MALNREKIVASAQKFIQRGQLDKAIKEFQRIVEEDPKDVRTLLKIGDLYSKKGERDNAIATYLKVAEFYSEQGFFLKAVAVYKQILKVDPSLIDVNVKLADLYGQLGLGSDALTQYQNVALYYEKAGQVPKTLQILRKMVDLDPQNVGIRIKLAEMFAKETQNKEAIEEFREAARVLKESQRLTDYAKVAERILFLDPENLVLAKELAEMYLKTQDVKRALAKLQVCFKADPRDVSVLEMLASAFLALGQTPKTVSVYRELAKIHAEKGEYEKRRQYLKSILELQPDDEETRSELEMKAPAASAPATAAPAEEVVGAPKADRPQAPPPPVASPLKPTEMIAKLLTETDVYVKYGLKDKALEHLKKIFSLAPDNLDAHAKVRDIYLQAGDIEGAGATLMSMAEIAEREGKKELSEGWLREVTKLIPGHPGATAKLSAITPDEAEILDDDMIQEAPSEEDDGGVEMVVDAPADEEPQEDTLPPLPEAAFDDTPGPSDGVALDAAIPSALDLSPTSDQVALEVDDGLEMPMPDDETDDKPASEPVSGETELSDDLADDDAGIGDDDEEDDITDDDDASDDAPPLPSVSFTPDSGIDLPPPSEDELALELEPPKKNIPVQSGEARIDPKPRVQSGESSLQRGAPPAVAFDDDLMAPAPSLELDAPRAEEDTASDDAASEPEAPEIEAPAATPPAPIEDEKTSPAVAAEAPDEDIDVSDELEEADFFEQQGLEDEAVEVYKNVLKKLPKNDVALKALARLGVEVPVSPAAPTTAAEDKGGTDKFAPIAPTPEPKKPAPTVVKSPTPSATTPAATVKPLAAITTVKSPAAVAKPATPPVVEKPVAAAAVKSPTPPPVTPSPVVESAKAPKVGGVTKSLINDSALDGDGFDLASELADDFADAESSAAADAPQEELQFSVEDVLSEFKKGVAATVSEKDFATHYDLGIAYKEMGLTDEAIREFEISSRAKEKEVDSLSMIGVCRMELGDHKGAIESFKKAANSDRITAQQAVAIQYELANAHEAAGDAETAKGLFAKVAKLDPKFRDAAARAAGKAAAAPAEDVDLAAQGQKDAPAKKGKISYL